jgi:hypothetical protein
VRDRNRGIEGEGRNGRDGRREMRLEERMVEAGEEGEMGGEGEGCIRGTNERDEMVGPKFGGTAREEREGRDRMRRTKSHRSAGWEERRN